MSLSFFMNSNCMIKMEKLKQQVRHYQLHAGKTYMQYEQDKYSTYQNYLYKRALYGLDALTTEELVNMCSKKKQRIINVYKRAQTVLNVFKQKLTIEYTNSLFKSFFPNSNVTKAMLELTETDEKFKNCLTFKDLNINKDDIIRIFISEGILPKNFLSLTEAPVNLPMLRSESKA
jgi:hypothetical protein